MTTGSFSLEEDGPLRLDVSWSPALPLLQQFTIRLDGNEVGKIRGHRALKRGREFCLPDGSLLEVKQAGDNLLLRRDGKLLYGKNPFKLEKEYARNCSVVFIIAAIGILYGVLSLLVVPDFVGGGIVSIAFGLVFFFLGLMALEKSLVALKAAIAIYIADWVLGIVLAVKYPAIQLPYSQNIFSYALSLPIKIVFISSMLNGLKIGKKLIEQEEKDGSREITGASPSTDSERNNAKLSSDDPPGFELERNLSRTDQSPPSIREQLRQLQGLQEEGLVTQEEFERKKREILERL